MAAKCKCIADTSNKPGRGRSRKPAAKTALQRLREFQARQKFDFLNSVVRKGK